MVSTKDMLVELEVDHLFAITNFIDAITSAETRANVHSAASRLKPYLVSTTKDRVTRMLRWIHGVNGIASKHRIELLLTLNEYFGTKEAYLDHSRPQSLTEDEWLTVGRVIKEPLFAPAKMAMRDTTNGDLHALGRRLKELSQAVPTKTLEDVVKLLLSVQSTSGHHKLVTTTTVENLTRMHRLHPPRLGFAGFSAWGVGDHQSPETNVRWHFLKHVCAVSESKPVWHKADELKKALPEGAAWVQQNRIFNLHDAAMSTVARLLPLLVSGPKVYPDEVAMWWRTLRINLRWSEVGVLFTAREQEHAKNLFTDDAGNGDLQLSLSAVPTLVQDGRLTANPRLLGYLLANYESAYRDCALRISANMTQPRIVVEDGEVFVSGFSDTVFVIGRFDKTTGDLGLSSCYHVLALEDKKKSQAKYEAWPLA